MQETQLSNIYLSIQAFSGVELLYSTGKKGRSIKTSTFTFLSTSICANLCFQLYPHCHAPGSRAKVFLADERSKSLVLQMCVETYESNDNTKLW